MSSVVIRISHAAFDNLQRRVKLSDPLATRNHTAVLVDRLLFECPQCTHQYECLSGEHTQCIKDEDIFGTRN